MVMCLRIVWRLLAEFTQLPLRPVRMQRGYTHSEGLLR